MKIRVSDGTNTIIFELNETSAAKSLYQMLPLKVTVENYSNNEKIFYPPWGNVVMYYGPASRYSGLYILGKAIEGADNIRNLSETIRVEVVGDTSGIHSIKTDHTGDKSQGYALNGIVATEGQKGVLIKDDKKILVK